MTGDEPGGTGIALGPRLRLRLERTLRLPDDGRAYPLTPDLGPLPFRRVDALRGSLPQQWRAAAPDDVLVPLHEREALFLLFEAAEWKPNAVLVGIGEVNAITGGSWDERLHDDPQDYLVCPPQPWLDGFNSGDGVIRQFVAVPLGEGYTVEGQLTGRESASGLRVVVWEPVPGRFPDTPPEKSAELDDLGTEGLESLSAAGPAPLGLGAGGRMQQKIEADPYGLRTWAERPSAFLRIYLVRAEDWSALTGEAPPLVPESAAAYTRQGGYWFSLPDNGPVGVSPPPRLGEVKSVRQIDVERGRPASPEEEPFDVPAPQVVRLGESEGSSRNTAEATESAVWIEGDDETP